MDYTPVLQGINQTLNELDSEISGLFSFLQRVDRALNVTIEYVNSLPVYFRGTVLLILSISIIYLILGR